MVSDGCRLWIGSMRSDDVTLCDDDVLVSRARGGEREAFGELVRRHHGAAMRTAAVICGSTQDAADVVQEAWVSAHRALGGFQGSGSVRSWLLRVVANHAKNHVRTVDRRRRRDDRHAGLDLRDVPSPEGVVVDRMERAALTSALGRLGMRDREVLACRFVTGLSEADTAEVLGVALGTVKSRTSRALGRLEAELKRAGSTRVGS